MKLSVKFFFLLCVILSEKCFVRFCVQSFN